MTKGCTDCGYSYMDKCEVYEDGTCKRDRAEAYTVDKYMKDKRFTFEFDAEFIKKVDYLKKSNGYKSRLETITKIIEERYDDERPSDCPNCVHFKDGYCDIWEREIDEEMWCTGFEKKEAST